MQAAGGLRQDRGQANTQPQAACDKTKVVVRIKMRQLHYLAVIFFLVR